MKKIWAVFFTATLVANISAGQYGLSGTIKSYYFNSPVASCFIQLRPESPTAKADSMYSDANGQYSFPDVWPGVYTIFVNHTDYLKDSVYLAIDYQVVHDFELLKKTNVYLTDLPDTLKKAMSPIIIGNAMDVNHSLVIQPGVAVILLGDVTMNGEKVTAIGRKTDSIVITSRGENIALTVSAPVQNYRFCSIKDFGAFWIRSDTSIIRSAIDSCRFSNIPSLFNQAIYTQARTIMQDNYFGNCDVDLECDSLIFRRNILDATLSIGINSKGLISNNNLNQTTFFLRSSSDTITNNIFQYLNISKNPTCSMVLEYNDILLIPTPFPGIGQPTIHNDNGELCDLFFNIFADPQIIDSATGTLSSTSPCIRAGQNGTNIGVWQGQGIVTAIASDKNRTPRLSAVGARSDYSLSMQVNGGRASNLQEPISAYSLNGRRLAVLTTMSNSLGSAKQSGRASGAYVLEMRFSGKQR